MNWLNLVQIAVVIIGSLADSANAGDPCETRASSCTELFCSEVQRRFGNISSAMERLANKLLDSRYETCDSVQNATLQVLEQGFLIRKASEKQEKKFDDIESAILDLRSQFSEKSNVMVQKYESLESYLFTSFSDMETGLEQKVAQLESKFEDRFQSLTQNYDDMSKMLKTILETVTIQTNGISNAIHVQTQKLDDVSIRKELENRELSCSEVQRSLVNVTSAMERLENKLFDTRYETSGFLQNATLQVLKQRFFIRQASETRDAKLDHMARAISDLRSQFSDKNNFSGLKYESLENALSQGFSAVEERLGSKFEEQFHILTQNYNMSKMLKTVLETVTIQTNGISNAVHVQTQKLEHHDVSILKELEKREFSCSEVQRSSGNISTAIGQLANKLHDSRYETLDFVQNVTHQVLENKFFIRQASETQAKKFDDIENAMLDLSSRVSEKNDVVIRKYESLENSLFSGFLGIKTALEEKLGKKIEERFITLTQNYDDLSKLLKNVLESVTIQSNGISNAIHLQTQKLEQHDVSILKELEKREAKFEEASNAASVLTNEISMTSSNLMQNYVQLKAALLRNLERVEGKVENIADQIKNMSNQCQKNTEEIMQRAELTLNTVANRIPRNASEILQTVSNELQLISERVLYEMGLFVSTLRYSNVRMVTNLTDYFQQEIFPKDTGIDRATFKCKVHCEKNETCKAFNIIETQDSFVCEILPDNLCLNQTKNALLNWPGSTVWEKTNTNTRKSCLEEKFRVEKHIPCQVLRPGCFGNWPRCVNCYKTCNNVGGDGSYSYTLWPEGDGPFATPLFGECYGSRTILLEREVNTNTGQVVRNFVMSFNDMHRLSRLQVYALITFHFFPTSSNTHWIYYKNPVITTDGTLSNFTYWGSFKMEDFLKLNGAALKPTPFANVTDDRYGCGSFWLLDANNATCCPGGKVSMLGQVKIKDGKVIRTGMSSPESIRRNDIIKRVKIYLDNL